MPWDHPGQPSGIVVADISPGSVGEVEFVTHTPVDLQPDEVLLEDRIDENGSRVWITTKAQDLATMFESAFPPPLLAAAQRLSDTAFQALLVHDTKEDPATGKKPHGYSKYLKQWRTEGLI